MASQVDRHGQTYLLMLPPEVITNIFCLLPSFCDVFTLSAACHGFRRMWCENTNQIYNAIAPRSIPCESSARRFLVDQERRSLDSLMYTHNVVDIVRDADVVEKAILQFEREVVGRVRSMSNNLMFR